MKAYVIGQPISHSLSPNIFRILAEVERSTLSYAAVEVTPTELSDYVANLRADEDFVGSNVTIPHKEAILSLVDDVTPDALAIGAANVIQATPRRLKAHNTDIIGIERTFSKQGFSPKDKVALLLGAGGSARAMAYSLAKSGARTIFIYNPRSPRGTELCAYLQKQFQEVRFLSLQYLEPSHIAPLDLVVNCTPIGMKGEGTEFYEGLKSLTFQTSALAFDLLYTPKHLPFLKVASSIGLENINGLNMLIEQALATWEIWIGRLKHGDELRIRLKSALEAILKSRENPKPIYLTGFMGVGKSTVARELSYALNRNFLDTDRLIEEKAHATISEIFETQGEAKFRLLESAALRSTHTSKNHVIALGGGALNDPNIINGILEHGTLIYLKATEQTLYRRLRNRAHQRPLLEGLHDDALKEKIADLLKKRLPQYAQAQLHVEIKAEDTPFDTAQMVLKAWSNSR